MKLLVYPVDLHLTYGHELWVATERMRMQIQVVEMSVTELSLRDRVRTSTIWEVQLLGI